MKNIKIDKNGDIIFDSLGKIQWVENIELIIQSLNLRLKTELGELFYNESYGHPKFKGKINQESLTIYLKETLLQDERVFNLEVVEFYKNGNYTEATVLIELNSGEEITLNYQF